MIFDKLELSRDSLSQWIGWGMSRKKQDLGGRNVAEKKLPGSFSRARLVLKVAKWHRKFPDSNPGVY